MTLHSEIRGKREVAPRSPQEVMRLARLGSSHPNRLSFMRILLRRAARENWTTRLTIWDLDANGVGTAVYEVTTAQRTYSLICYSHDLPAEMRSDRVIAEAWDATFTLFDGSPDADDIERLRAHVPLQEAGRMTERELTLSRANRSVRLFEHVVECLAAGRQPERDRLIDTGYLMRTTAVYGSGKFGLADRVAISDRPELQAPFQVEMLTVWLIRQFTVDLVEHLALSREEGAVPLDPELRRLLGVGNSTGLGMAPFLLRHPRLIHQWFKVREDALTAARLQPVCPESWERFRQLVGGLPRHLADWQSEHPLQRLKLEELQNDVRILAEIIKTGSPTNLDLWDDVWQLGQADLGLEGQELLLSLILELFPEIVDTFATDLSADEECITLIDGSKSVRDLMAEIERSYGWALALDWDDPSSIARLWYVSEEKLEPRLAERFDEDLGSWEQPLGIARDVSGLHQACMDADPDSTIRDFLRTRPEFRHVVRRVQMIRECPFGEIYDNTISAGMLPIDMLRAKLSFFGATSFDPRSDRWVRVSMFQRAPGPDELSVAEADSWMYRG